MFLCFCRKTGLVYPGCDTSNCIRIGQLPKFQVLQVYIKKKKNPLRCRPQWFTVPSNKRKRSNVWRWDARHVRTDLLLPVLWWGRSCKGEMKSHCRKQNEASWLSVNVTQNGFHFPVKKKKTFLDFLFSQSLKKWFMNELQLLFIIKLLYFH